MFSIHVVCLYTERNFNVIGFYLATLPVLIDDFLIFSFPLWSRTKKKEHEMSDLQQEKLLQLFKTLLS